jgi:amidase
MVEMSWGKFEAYQALTEIGKLYVGNLVAYHLFFSGYNRKKYAQPDLK